MSYNPTRVNKNKRAGRQRPQYPHAGRKHSQIVARRGPQAINVIDARNRQPAAHGWMVPQFKGDQFEVIYYYFCARNNTGEIRNNEHDRCVKVLSGQIFVLLSGQPEAMPLNAGQTFTIEKGTPYRLSTSGTGDAELMFCQGKDYDESIEVLAASSAVNLVQAVKDPPAVRSRPDRRTPSKAKVQAQKIAKKQEARIAGKRTPMKKREPLSNSSAVQGVNPQPVGSGGYSE